MTNFILQLINSSHQGVGSHKNTNTISINTCRPSQRSTVNFSSILPMQPLTEQIVTLKNVFTRDLETKITSSVNSLLLYTSLPWLVCLFKNLVNQVAINVATWPVTSNSLFNIFGWRSTPLWTWSGFGLTTTNYSINERPSHLLAHALSL